MLLSVTAASMTFAQQVSENNSLIPVEGVTLPVWEHINHVAYCQERYFSILDSKGIEHVFDSSFKEIYTVQSELIDNVFYNIPYSHVIINLNVDQQQFFDNDSGTFTQKLFNDDSELEYFAFDCKVTSDGDPVVGGMVLTFDGFKIMQTNGNCIAEVKLPEESITITGNHPIRDMMSADFVVFVIDENIYIYVSWGWGNSFYIFKYDKGNAGAKLQPASSEPSQAAYPNPVKAGQPLNIKYKQGISNAVVNITGLNGTLIQSFNVTSTAGGTLSIPTDELTSGIYLYDIISNNKVAASGKIVVE